jgi:transposase
MPDQMKLPFALWTAQAVRALIHKKFGKTLGLSTMPLYLKRWGLSFPRFGGHRIKRLGALPVRG